MAGEGNTRFKNSNRKTDLASLSASFSLKNFQKLQNHDEHQNSMEISKQGSVGTVSSSTTRISHYYNLKVPKSNGSTHLGF